MSQNHRVHLDGISAEEFRKRTGEELESFIRRRLDDARAARERAYAPYSDYRVGAAIVTGASDPSIIGVNVENASYGSTICAERAAVVSAISTGHREFGAIAIAGPEGSATAPCGACRQFLNEFNPRLIVVHTTPSGVTVTTLDKLLPDPFSPEDLAAQ